MNPRADFPSMRQIFPYPVPGAVSGIFRPEAATGVRAGPGPTAALGGISDARALVSPDFCGPEGHSEQVHRQIGAGR